MALGQVSSARLAQMDSVIAEQIANKKTAGRSCSRRPQRTRRLAQGLRRSRARAAREAMTVDTIFDLASLTKVVATATSIMILVERGKVRLSDPLSLHIPELKGEGRERITIEHLLTHVSGYAPDFDLRERWTGYDEAIKRLDQRTAAQSSRNVASPTATSDSSRWAKWSREPVACHSINLRKRTSLDHSE